MYLLDTNVISELRRLGDGKADARVVAWVSDRNAADFYVSALTLMELEIGILRIERRDVKQGRSYGPGWTAMFYPSSCRERCPSIPLLP